MGDVQSLLFYLAAFSFASLLIYLGGRKRYSKGISTTLVLIGLLIPSILTGLRYEVGSDYLDYERIYEHAVTYNAADFNVMYENRSIEPSFYVLSNISHTLTSDSSMLFAFYGFLTVALFYLAARYFSVKWAWLSFFVFMCIYFPIGLSAIRQFAAMAIFVFAIRYIVEKKPLRYVACIVVASLFHQTSIILLPVYFLGRFFLKNKTGWLRLIPTISLGVILIATPIISLLLSIPIFARYEYMTELERSATYVGGTYYVQLLMLGIFALFFSSFFKTDRNYRLLFPIFMTGILLYGVGFRFSSGWRLALYMLPVAALLVPSLVEAARGGSRKYVALAAISFSIVYFIAVYYIAGNFDIFPYQFIGAN